MAKQRKKKVAHKKSTKETFATGTDKTFCTGEIEANRLDNVTMHYYKE